MTDQPLFVHYHLPKTGGQTIRTALVRHLTPGDTVLHLGGWARQHGFAPHDNAGIAELTQEERDRVRAVTGHRVDEETLRLFAGRTFWELTILRDPAERMVSHYNFDRFIQDRHGRPGEGFEEWYAVRKPNEMCRYLAHRWQIHRNDLNGLIERFTNLQFVGDTAAMDSWLPDLMTVMGLPSDLPKRVNVTGVDHQRHLQIDDELRERIETDHPLDSEIFQLAKAELFPEGLDRLRRDASHANDEVTK